ncbi:MAG: DNA helicase HerA-like ATPase [Candidatus Woesearchaeota archaeon]|jgi:DNA helicase HerA-like ATPase
MIKGQIISGTYDEVIVRQKNEESIQLGELLIAQHQEQTYLLQATDVSFGSQLSSQQLELLSGMFLEEEQEITFFEANLRNYLKAHMKPLLKIEGNQANIAKSLPTFFSTVRSLKKEDLSFMTQTDGINLGNVRSGNQIIDVPVILDIQKVLSHHMLIPATTGKGKSNLMSVLLWRLLNKKECASLVFDPHDEYYGRLGQGLKDHPQFSEYAKYYTTQAPPPGQATLTISFTTLKPKHFSGVADFSPPQFELLYAYHAAFGKNWIKALFEKKDCGQQFHEHTPGVVIRKLSRLLSIQYINEEFVTKGVFSFTQGETTLQDITTLLKLSKTVIMDTSHLEGSTELLVSSLVTAAVYDAYKHARTTKEKVPVVSIVLEEAPRVLGKDVLAQGQNIFSTIAKEGRKFNVGLCAITQLPSLIPKDILANMNTKIILGIEMAPERQAIIDSAAQDLSKDSRNIASLDKGQAIISSNFARFATPVQIPLFSKVVQDTKINHGIKKHSSAPFGIE